MCSMKSKHARHKEPSNVMVGGERLRFLNGDLFEFGCMRMQVPFHAWCILTCHLFVAQYLRGCSIDEIVCHAC